MMSRGRMGRMVVDVEQVRMGAKRYLISNRDLCTIGVAKYEA